MFSSFSTSKCLDLFLVTLSLMAFNLASKYVFVIRPVISCILFSTVVNAEVVAKLLISGILFSTAVNAELLANPLILVLPSTSVIFVLKSVFLTKLLKSGIFFSILSILYSKSDPSFSSLVLETKFVLSIRFTLLTNLSYSVYFTTSFLTTLLNLAKSIGTEVSLSISSFSTSVFRLAKFDFSA